MTNVPTRPRDAPSRIGDAALIKSSLDDPERFEALFTRHVRAIYAFACARVGPAHADDVTAETFAAAFRSRSRFDQRAASARPWLYGIAANTLRRHHEHEMRWLRNARLQHDALESEDQFGIEDRLDAVELVPRLAAALASLNAGERDVLALHVLEGFSHEEVASALGIRRGTAKSRLSRGRARLRDVLPELAGPFDHPRDGDDHA